jgi:hypothetical protein
MSIYSFIKLLFLEVVYIYIHLKILFQKPFKNLKKESSICIWSSSSGEEV